MDDSIAHQTVVALNIRAVQTFQFTAKAQRRKGRKEDNALVAANFIEYFLCDLCGE